MLNQPLIAAGFLLLVLRMTIGLFDTGHGGLTIYKSLKAAMPHQSFVYLGDHAHAPYGQRSGADILALTKNAIAMLFEQGCPLVVLACNTATAVALRSLQQNWLPQSAYKANRVLGIIAPTVEAATGVNWGDAQHQTQQNDVLAVFATQRTIESGVYEIEIRKRSPKVEVVQQICAHLAGAIEEGASEAVLEEQVRDAVAACLKQTHGRALSRAILGCTHFPIVEHLFKKYLPSETQILSQGPAVAARLTDYLNRHPEFAKHGQNSADRFITSGDAARVSHDAARFVGLTLPFETKTIPPIL